MKSSVGEMQRMYQHLREMMRQLAAIQQTYHDTPERIQQLMGIIQNKAMFNLLKATPLTTLAEATDRNIPSTALHAAGIENSADLAEVVGKGRTVGSIQPSAWRQIQAALAQFEALAKPHLDIGLGTQPMGEIQEKVLRRLYFYQWFETVAEEVTAIQTQFEFQVVPVVSNVQERDLNPAKHHFVQKNTRTAYLDQIQVLRDFYQQHGDAITSLLEKAGAVQTVAVAKLSRDYQTYSENYEAVLRAYAPNQTSSELSQTGSLSSPMDQAAHFQLNTQLLTASLQSWQNLGAKFILYQHQVLLGDEMGLGKGLQALAVMANMAAIGRKYFVILCGDATMTNWRWEIEAKTSLNVITFDPNDPNQALESWLANGGIALLNYQTATQLHLNKLRLLDVLVCDQAEHLQIDSDFIREIAMPLIALSDYTVLISGSPLLQNPTKLADLVGLLRPKVGDALLSAVRPLDAATQADLDSVYLNRRYRDLEADLPTIIEKDSWLTMQPEESAVYQRTVYQGDFQEIRQAAWESVQPKHAAKMQRLLILCQQAKADNRKVVVCSAYRHVLELIAV